MRTQLCILASLIVCVFACSNEQKRTIAHDNSIDSVTKIEMKLSAFGVESDDYPSIDVMIDFSKDTSICIRSFYNPANKGSTYSLTKSEMAAVSSLLNITDLKSLKEKYTVDKTDEPRSKTTIYTTEGTFIIDDYGLEGEYPLQKLYKIVYRI